MKSMPAVEIMAVLQRGDNAGIDRFTVTTEKDCDMYKDFKAGHPYGRLRKMSKYTIQTGLKWLKSMPSFLRPDPLTNPDLTWTWTDNPKVVRSVKNAAKQYILCGFANGYAEPSSFVDVDTGAFFEKSEVKEWLTDKGDMPAFVTLGFSSIVELTMYEIVKPKATAEPAFAWLADLKAA